MPNSRKIIALTSAPSSPLRKPEVIAQLANRETMLFDMSTGHYFSLNELGARVWDLADGLHSSQQIAALLEAEYDAPYSVIEADVLALVRELCDNNLIS